MHANLLGVFGERDPARRAEVIARTYADDVVFADPESVVVGHAAIRDKAQSLIDQSPDFVFTAAGPVLESQDLGYLTWNLGPAGAPPVVKGVDIALVRDGVIAKLYTLILP
ncbi:nuclear transport factor 2 family protein [Naasia lichenicola]|uniref:Nuclear transport factor 2 family protein n=2 Tax=Naasia lichenicola TaxID=2565933 RepID=A0A4S4FJE6_9MICO|nr:nuclear transport factor 2 family protein [Naasia lichenicola]